jgi:hypothetical protein
VLGESSSGQGVWGYIDTGYGVRARSDTGIAVYGRNRNSEGILCSIEPTFGFSIGVYGWASMGVTGLGSNLGVYGDSHSGYDVYGHSGTNYAAFLDGNVRITGNLQKAGGSFKIDHPLDLANKYLSHSSVESPDMKNVYDGVVALDDKGEAQIDLPDWFGAFNKDFRYQLTAIEAPVPNLHIAEEISDGATTNCSSSNNKNNNNSRFKVADGTSGMKVSWQVTGIRQDPWANAHRIKVDENKPDKERGYYIHPDPYGQQKRKE